ncbi:MAG: hypothetical protein LBO76_07805, partial [Treponema sp.]|nr:hypothetical protein [Treponema sp.]
MADVSGCAPLNFEKIWAMFQEPDRVIKKTDKMGKKVSIFKFRRFFFLFHVFGALWFTACAVPTDNRPNSGNQNVITYESRIFNVQRLNVDTEEWYTLSASKLAEGAYCIIYVSDTELVPVSLAKFIASEYDANIYDAMTGVFGDYMAKGFDVDANGKTILLLLDIMDGYVGSGGFVAGFFDPVHMYDTSTYAHSNYADMLFIDINPQSPRSMGFYVTLAHELQHLINFAMHNGFPQETWLNEGLSSAAEYLYGGHQWSRINYFNADPLGTIAQGNNFFVWDGHWEDDGDSLANYATAYLFFQWLRIQSRDPSIYRAIAASEFRDYRAVTQAAKDRIGIGNGTGSTDDEKIWGGLLSSWMIANYQNDPFSLYGYRGEWKATNLKKHNIASPTTPVKLSPGEGVFSEKKQNSSRFTGQNHIHYKEIEITSAIPGP